MSTFEELQRLISDRNIHIRLLISKPRSGSTMLGSSLSRGSDVGSYIHEPFVRLGYYGEDADSGYANIKNAIVTDRVAPGGTVIIKDMAHWIEPQHEYENLFKLTDGPILFLTRNPILSMESRIRKVIYGLNTKYRQAIHTRYVDAFGSPVTNDISSPELHDAQTKFLNQYAQEHYAEDWETLVQESINTRDYARLEGILSISEIFPAGASGDLALTDELQFARSQQLPYMLLDSTEYRIAPQDYARQVCEKWGIEPEESMTSWEGVPLNLETGQNKSHHQVWYDTYMKSTEVLPPTEEPIHLSRMPKTLRNQLLTVDIPLYMRLFQDEHRIRAESSLLDYEFAQDGRRTTIKEVDPLFSLATNPNLYGDEKFRQRHASFFAELRDGGLIMNPQDEIFLSKQAKK